MVIKRIAGAKLILILHGAFNLDRRFNKRSVNYISQNHTSVEY